MPGSFLFVYLILRHCCIAVISPRYYKVVFNVYFGFMRLICLIHVYLLSLKVKLTYYLIDSMIIINRILVIYYFFIVLIIHVYSFDIHFLVCSFVGNISFLIYFV